MIKKYIVPLTVVFILQIFLSNLLSIRGVRPDFIILFLIYFSLNQGSFRGVIVGFSLGLIISVFDNNPLFGILPLTYSIIGYGIGLLKNHRRRLTPLKFNIICYSIIIFSFFVYNYFLFDVVFYNNFSLFLVYWFKNMIYTVTLLVISQIFFPLQK